MAKKLIIGLDIGASKITGIVFDGRESAHDLTVRTPENLIDFKSNLKKLIGSLSAGKKINKIGIGIPGLVDNRGRVAYAPNLGYLVGFNLPDFVRPLGMRTVRIDNDANCFALAEAQLGQGKNHKNFIGITLGTGIGGGLILNGSLYRGSRGGAGEIGHLLAGGRRTYEDYFQKYRKVRNYPKLGGHLGRLAADAVNLLDPEALILGGSVAALAGEFLPALKREAKKHILNKSIQLQIKISRLKNAGALGAAFLLKPKK